MDVCIGVKVMHMYEGLIKAVYKRKIPPSKFSKLF